MITMRVHSVIDVITNSSTEIYSYVDGNAVDATYEMLDAVIKSVGGTQSAREMFVVTAGPNIGDLWDRLNYIDYGDCDIFDKFIDTYWPEYKKYWGDRDKDKNNQEMRAAREAFEDDVALQELLIKRIGDDSGLETTVHIKAKNGDDSVAKAVETFLGCFHAEEYSC